MESLALPERESAVIIFTDQIGLVEQELARLLAETMAAHDLQKLLRQYSAGEYSTIRSSISLKLNAPSAIVPATLMRALCCLKEHLTVEAFAELKALDQLSPTTAASLRACLYVPFELRPLISRSVTASTDQAQMDSTEADSNTCGLAQLIDLAYLYQRNQTDHKGNNIFDQITAIASTNIASRDLLDQLADTYYEKALTCSRAGDHMTSVFLLMKLTSLRPNDGRAHVQSAYEYAALEEDSLALESFSKALLCDQTGDGTHASAALKGIAQIHAERRNWVEAEQAAREALAIDPVNMESLAVMTHIFAETRDVKRQREDPRGN